MSVVGILDLVELHGSDIQIVDFKTGKASPGHIDQLLFYCVLWWRVTGRAPRSIVVQYPGDRRESSVGEEEILLAEKKFLHKIALMEAELKSQPAQAVTGAHCRYCPVRARCDDGWRSCQREVERNGRTDVELVVTDDTSSNGFLAMAGTANISVVYSVARGRKFKSKFVGGNRLRLLDVYCDRDKASYEIGDYSEVYICSRQ